ncbi:hypothetical protein L9F63_000654 [Diploptera punctata]|uniref:RanBD1 domain-containing protein n=1 Tax=Diploptera punctata TaxID=6984 RepID=A0AAD8AM77_DIPPU|nr:hypothetical protein L9F63_000654 [Diploptera punctata]
MTKRNATSELNHDNWNEEEKPEEAGTYKKASPDVMQTRIIKSAKRRSIGTSESSLASKSPFSAFGGFKATSSSSSPFSFLSNSNKTSEETSNGKKMETNNSEENSAEYYSSLKGLNQCVSQWIKSHVDKNPFCILTPIFKDYERYLSEIDGKEAKRKRDKSLEKSVTSSTTGSSERAVLVSYFWQSVAMNYSTTKPAEDNEKKEETTLTAPSFTTTAPKFNFGSGASMTSTNLSAGFTFASSSSQKPFTFTNVAKVENKESGDGDEEDEPAKVEFKPVVEEGSIYSKRCKVFVKKDDKYQDRGVGMLYVKPVEEKTQLIVRADTSLGNILLNTLLTSGMPIQRLGANNVMLVCIPTPDAKPPPVTVLLRLKTGQDADEALEKLKERIK